MSKSLYLNKTERLGMHLNIALAFYNSTLAPYERERQGSQRGWLSSVPKYGKKSWLPLSLELKALNIVSYCKVLAATEVVNLLGISSSIDRKKNNCGIL